MRTAPSLTSSDPGRSRTPTSVSPPSEISVSPARATYARFYTEEVHDDSCRTSSPDHDHPWSLTAPPSPSRPGTLVVPEPRSPVVPHVHVGPRRPRTTSTSGWPLTYGPPGSSHTVLEDPPQRHNDTGHLKMEDTGGTTIRTCLRWPSCVLPVLVAVGRRDLSSLSYRLFVLGRVKRVPPV